MSLINKLREQSARFLALLIVFVLPLALFRWNGLVSPYQSKLIPMGLISVAFILSLVTTLLPWRRLQLKSWPCLFLALFLLWTLASCLWGHCPTDPWLNFSDRYEGILTFALYALFFFIGRSNYHLGDELIYTFTASASLVSLMRICQFYDFRPLSKYLYGNGNMNIGLPEQLPFGTFGNPNFFATFIVMALPFCLYLLFVKRFYWALLPFFVQLAALLLNGSRSAYVGGSIALVVWFVLLAKFQPELCRRNKNLLLTFALAGLLFLLLIFASKGQIWERALSIPRELGQFLRQLFQADELSSTLGASRLGIWRYCLLLLPLYPLWGTGLGGLHTALYELYPQNLDEIFSQHGVFVDRAHNEYIQLAVQSGIPALLFYLLFVGSLLKSAWPQVKAKPRYLLVFVCIIAYLSQAFFNISVPVTAWLFWFLLGLLSSKESLS